MAHATHPEHSGEAISILKVLPYSEGGVVLTSTAIDPEGRIDRRYAAEGDNLSPPLAWDAVEGAGAYALIVEDPDAPRETPFVHWLAWNIPGEATALPEGLPNAPRLMTPQDMVQGRNDAGSSGWYGPKPPAGHGPHHYHFQLFALDGPLDLHPDADVRTLVDAIKGRTLAQGDLVGVFETPDAAPA
jgi:Raf kinase inhibitor-like YbhB/YbcL family protein